jgi:hypothetical protein
VRPRRRPSVVMNRASPCQRHRVPLHRIVTAAACAAVLVALHDRDAGGAPSAGTRSAIELLGGGKVKRLTPRVSEAPFSAT